MIPERTGFRNEDYSRRHRLWGKPLYTVDIDEVCCIRGVANDSWPEFRHNTPVLLLEVKAVPKSFDRTSSNVAKIRNLANMARLPFLGVRYGAKTWTFQLFWGNKEGQDLLMRYFDGKLDNVTLSEEEYVSFLYNIRGLDYKIYRNEHPAEEWFI